MKRMRLFLVLFTIAAFAPVFSDAALQSLRATYTVTIVLAVTGMAYAPHPAPVPATGSGNGIVARMIVNKNEDPRRYRAENLSFADGGGVGGNVVAQSVKQGAVEVKASISPNPLGTLLYCSDTEVPVGCSSTDPLPVTAGTQATFSCEYKMVVDTTQTNWTLEHGLYSDFESTGVVAFPGKDLYQNTHIATPNPAFTPFIVYSDGQSWAVAGSSGGMKTFCVDLQITVPSSVSTGTYSSNATYLLYY